MRPYSWLFSGAPGVTILTDDNNKFFVDVYQRHDQPPATQVVDASGRPRLAASTAIRTST
jgi:hypothetical protein